MHPFLSMPTVDAFNQDNAFAYRDICCKSFIVKVSVKC